ncbi:MAG: hypothetical protein GC162_03335 [Planctomycetes bacterium]|nr:hypothetical protein [Planctomycetota bacterium]
MPKHFCPRCGGGNQRSGHVRNLGKVYFEFGGSGLFRRRGQDVPVGAVMCLDCGHIELRADVEALSRRAIEGPGRAAIAS